MPAMLRVCIINITPLLELLTTSCPGSWGVTVPRCVSYTSGFWTAVSESEGSAWGISLSSQKFTDSWTPNAWMHRLGIHCSMASRTLRGFGFLWVLTPQVSTLDGLLLPLADLAQSSQITSQGTSATRAHTPRAHPWSLPRHTKQPSRLMRSLRSVQEVAPQNSTHPSMS